MGIETVTPKWVGTGQYGLSVGIQGVGNKLTYLRVSDKSGLKESDFAVGRPVTVKVYVGPKGGRSIDGIVTSEVPPLSTTPVHYGAAKTASKMAYGRPLSAYEEEKDRRIHISGVLQAVIHSPAVSALSSTKAEFVENVKSLTKEFLAFAQEEVKNNGNK